MQLRKKLQLTTLALAELAAEKSNKLKEKYIRLILFKPPPEEEKVDDEQGPKKGTKISMSREIIIYLWDRNSI